MKVWAWNVKYKINAEISQIWSLFYLIPPLAQFSNGRHYMFILNTLSPYPHTDVQEHFCVSACHGLWSPRAEEREVSKASSTPWLTVEWPR